VSRSAEELERFVAGLAETPELWKHHVRHSDEERIYEQIWDDDDVNAWLICWSEDNDTGFHDHDDSTAAIAVVEGQVREERLRFGSSPDVRVIGAGGTFTVASTAIHRVRHTGDSPAVTIHAYAPPLRRTGTYRIGPRGELERLAQSYEEELRGENLGRECVSARQAAAARD
jgi:mannose-6-phosphate isomerase-like protein (cupin superfamily)